MISKDLNTAYQPGVALDDMQLILEKTPRNVWDTLRNQRIFITGGTGFVGCWLIEALLWAHEKLGLNLSLTVLSRDPCRFVAKAPHLANHIAVKLITGNVTDLKDINAEFDTIIHAATDVVNPETDFLAAYNSIVNGSIETLELAKRSGASRYLLTSSGAVYGQQPATLTHTPESYAGAPATHLTNSAYGQAKRISEWLTHSYAKENNIDIRIARCFALIGPYLPLDAHFAVGNFIRDGLNNKTIKVNGDGTAFRSYLYAADMIIWLLTMLINGDKNQTYNLGSEKAISIKDLAETVSDIIYNCRNTAVAEEPKSNAAPQYYVPATLKAKDALGLEEYTDLHASIRKTITWEIHHLESTPQKNG